MINKNIYGMCIVIFLLLMIFVMPASANLQKDLANKENWRAPLPESVIFSETELKSVSPAVAYNAQRDQYLVVWYNDGPENDDIQGQRLDHDGKILGPRFYISTGPGHDRRYPDVAYDSKHDQYLIVWEDYHHDTLVKGYGIRGKLVSGSGNVSDPTSSWDIVFRDKAGTFYSGSPPAPSYGNKWQCMEK